MATDMPLGLIVRDGERDGQPAFEAWANGEGPPLGRELELAELLSFIRTHGIRNVVWITADVHYAAALHYDPSRAVTKDFLPFWEFVAGPLHAGNFGPNAIDPTFGPEVKYQSAQPGGPQNRPPSEGYQYLRHADDRRRERQAVRGAVRRSRRATLRRGSGSVGSGGRHVARRRAARCQLHAERCLGDEHAPRTERDDLQPDGT